MMQASDQNLIRRVADYRRISGIFWIALGVVQICLIVTVLAGIWNIFAGITRIKASKRIRERDPAVPAEFESVRELVVIGIINLVCGGVIGVVFVAFDFYVRDQVLSNRHLFTGMGGLPSAVVVPPFTTTLPTASFDEHLRLLAKLRDEGIITADDFGQKKKQILGL